MTTVRMVELARGGWGLALLLAPDRVLTQVHGLVTDARTRAVARVLGARQLAQATLSGVDPTPEILAMGVWVDLAHAATAVGLAVVDRNRARAGLVDTVAATTWAGAGYRDLREGHSARRQHDRLRDGLARMVLGVVPGGAALLRAADRRRNTATPSPTRETP